MAENSINPELNPSKPGEQAAEPDERSIIYRSEEPVEAYLETGEPVLSWLVDLVPAFDPPQEPWWGYAARDYEDPATAVGVMKLGKTPPDAALGFIVFTARTGPDAKERLQKVIENIRILGNYQLYPAEAIRLILAPTASASHQGPEVEEDLEAKMTPEEAAEFIRELVHNSPEIDERILGPAQPYQPPERISYPRTTEPLN